MALTKYKEPGENGLEPVVPIMIDAVMQLGQEIWYCRNPAAWHDIVVKAQLAANSTGHTQYLVAHPVGPHVTHYVTPDPATHSAYGGHHL